MYHSRVCLNEEMMKLCSRGPVIGQRGTKPQPHPVWSLCFTTVILKLGNGLLMFVRYAADQMTVRNVEGDNQGDKKPQPTLPQHFRAF